MNPVIEALIANPGQYFATDQKPIVVQTEHRRFTYSCMEICTLGFEGKELKVFVKAPATGGHELKLARLKTEFSVLQELSRLFADCQSLGVPRPVGLFPGLESIVTEECPGEPFGRLLSRGARRWSSEFGTAATACRLAGQWLRTFHAATADSEAVLDVQGLIDYCQFRIDYLVKTPTSGVTSALGQRVMRTIVRLANAGSGEAIKVAGCHNDFSPNNILVSDGRLFVIDFTMFDHQPIFFDLYSFWTNLELLKHDPQFSRRRLSRMQEEFLSSYGVSLDHETPIMTAVRYRNMLTKMTTLLDPAPTWYGNMVRKRMYRFCLDWVIANAR